MSRPGRPKVHEHLSREAIAQAALALIDGRGAEALTLRAIAGELGVGTTSLYHYVADRETIVGDIVGLLLAEVDTTQVPGETWDQSVRRVGRSLREMALRHPKAFPLVALASVDDPLVQDYAARIERLHSFHGIPDSTFRRMWSVLDAFLAGFLLLLATSCCQEAVAQGDADASREACNGPPVNRSEALSAEAFDHDLDIIIEGIRKVEMLDDHVSVRG